MSRNVSTGNYGAASVGDSFDPVHSPIDGSAIIEASAGTGKTFNISHIFLRLILEKGLPIEKILIVTFTVAATDELKERIRRLLRETEEILLEERGAQDGSLKTLWDIIEKNLGHADRTELLARIQTALRHFDDASIFTIHGFCKKILSELSFETGGHLRPEIGTDSLDEEMETRILDFWRTHLYSEKNSLFRRYAYGELEVGKLRKIAAEFLKNYRVELPPIENVDTEPYEKRFISIVNSLIVDNYDPSRIRELYLGLREYLNGTTYTEETVVGLIDGLLHSLGNRAEINLFNLFENESSNHKLKNRLKFSLLTRSRMNSSLKGRIPESSIPPHPFIDTFSELHTAWIELKRACVRKIAFLTHALCDQIRTASGRADKEFLSFQDLIFHLHAHLDNPSRSGMVIRYARETYGAALIDEFQDTDRFQWDIFRKIFRYDGSVFFLIGDPKQSIYRFRGADISAYIRATDSIKRRHTLNANFRSSPELIGALNTIFSQSAQKKRGGERGFLHPQIVYREVIAGRVPSERLEIRDEPPSPFQLLTLPQSIAESKMQNRRRAIFEAICASILNLLNGSVQGANLFRDIDHPESTRQIRPRDIAVLVRSGAQAREFQKSLRRLGINAVLQLDESVFDSEEAEDLLTVLRAVETPGRIGAVAAALATRTFGCDSKTIHDALNDSTTVNDLFMRFHGYSQTRIRSGFMAMFERILNDRLIENPEETLRTQILSRIGGERRITNLVHIAELLHGEGLSGIAADIKWMGREIASVRTAQEERQIRLESDEDAVQIMTVHRSKGLEFPIVYCPFLWESRGKLTKVGTPVTLNRAGSQEGQILIAKCHLELITVDPQFQDRPGWPKKDEIDAEINAILKESFAEEIRIFYVALTRAAHRCYLVWDPYGIKPNKEGRAFTPSNTPPAAVVLHGIDPFSEEGYNPENVGRAIEEDLKNLVVRSDGTIAVMPLQTPPERPGYYTNESQTAPVEPPEYKSMRRSYQITSYSRLHAGRGEETFRDYEDAKRMDEETEGEGIMKFDRGSRAGNFFHSLYEDLDFMLTRDGITERVQETLLGYGFSPATWGDVVTDHVISTLNAKMQDGESAFTLSSVRAADKIHEMDFVCRLRPSTTAVPDGEDYSLLRESLKRADGIENNRGFMRGAIDLIFRRGERYYLLDWKSNHLGNRRDLYTPSRMREAMLDHNYVLQYFIYLSALDLHLRTRIRDYDYRRHFGGIYYLFLRGISPDGDTGIFFDRPNPEVLQFFQSRIMDSEGDRR